MAFSLAARSSAGWACAVLGPAPHRRRGHDAGARRTATAERVPQFNARGSESLHQTLPVAVPPLLPHRRDRQNRWR